MFRDDKKKSKKLNKTIWGIAGVGLISIFIGVRLANPTILLIGVTVVSIAALMTRHFDERIEELTKQRKRIAI
jgi:ABC-type proline/glycine betaine transport system permease subunit